MKTLSKYWLFLYVVSLFIFTYTLIAEEKLQPFLFVLICVIGFFFLILAITGSIVTVVNQKSAKS
jgi:hypothetical protein